MLAYGRLLVGAQQPRAASGGGDPGRGLGERPGRGAGAGAGTGVGAGAGARAAPSCCWWRPDDCTARLGSFLYGATQTPLLPRV